MAQRRFGLGFSVFLAGVLQWSTVAAVPVFANGFEAAAQPTSSADADAARFLNQATFGARLSDVQRLRQIGQAAWLDEQFAAPVSLELPWLQWVAARPAGQNEVYQAQRLEAWLIHAAQLADPSDPPHRHNDQLRQRMAFALSEIFVISDRNGPLTFQPWATASFYDLLAQNAFGNYRDLLEAVTLHPAMGRYLSMIGNRRPDPELNIRPDENYAREVLQLFSVGLNRLNADGSPQLQNGQPIPTYNQNVVRGFAHVFTGWNFAGCSADDYDYCEPSNDYELAWRQPMQAVEALHDNSTDKTLLDYPGVRLAGGVLVHGGDARNELTAALDNIFQHPNVGPFLSRQLIQRLITSNPSAAYVQRVASVFDDNGAGVRGDLKAVTRAILLDPEARAAPDLNGSAGKLREPILKLVHLWRAVSVRSGSGRVNLLIDPAEQYGQAPLRAPSVFNFFKPNFAQPGEIRAAGQVSPEFQIATDTQIVATPNDLGWRIFYFYLGSDYDYAAEPDQVLLDYAGLQALAADPAVLIERLNLLLLSGQMSPSMREILRVRLAELGTENGGRERVQHALYLILNSPEYAVLK